MRYIRFITHQTSDTVEYNNSIGLRILKTFIVAAKTLLTELTSIVLIEALNI